MSTGQVLLFGVFSMIFFCFGYYRGFTRARDLILAELHRLRQEAVKAMSGKDAP